MGAGRILGTSVALVAAGALAAPAAVAGPSPHRDKQATWTQVLENADASDTRWSARAGLQAVTLGSTVYVLGGRVPNEPDPEFPIPGDSTLLNDVWSSSDRGETWENLVPTGAAPDMWSPRAYFSAVTKGEYMYVLGGQDYGVIPNPECPLPSFDPPSFDPPSFDPPCSPFISTSQFFNDVWRSRDGRTWEQMTPAAPWEGRAGLSAAVLDGSMYVFGGSVNDDSAVIGGPPVREYFNDVWKSRDNGRTWEEVNSEAPWSERAGAATVVKGGHIYLLGGEVGFTCASIPGDCDPPYFNELPVNPTDAWWSGSGQQWHKLAGAAWNAATPDEAKYDFDSAVIPDRRGRPAIYTFGGDRETFDFDAGNYLRVDNDVWQLRLGRSR